MTHAPLLARVREALETSPLTEADIREPDLRVEGMCTGRHLTINAGVAMADVLVHEAIHAAFPHYSERAVRSRTSWLINRMSEAEIQSLYRTYTRRRRQRKSPVNLSE